MSSAHRWGELKTRMPLLLKRRLGLREWARVEPYFQCEECGTVWIVPYLELTEFGVLPPPPRFNGGCHNRPKPGEAPPVDPKGLPVPACLPVRLLDRLLGRLTKKRRGV
jgi:hypothetical protein